ncbi:MAG: sulfite exporter TauE/SafE family protein [Planctomycetota bacterium]|jgi:uncharacterized membrane protein YfcA
MEIIVLSLLTIIASFIAGVSGFGFAVFLMGFFPIFLGVKDANVLVSLAGIAFTVYMFLPFRRKVRWWIVARVFAGMAIGIPAGVWILVRVDERFLTIGLGSFIILYIVYDLLFRHRIKKQVPLFFGYFAGFLGGAFAGAITAGGPPIVAFFSSLEYDKETTKANLLAYISVASLYKAVFLVYYSLITKQMLVYTAYLTVPSFIGMFAGRAVFNKMSNDVFRRVVLGILFAAAVIILLKGAFEPTSDIF